MNRQEYIQDIIENLAKCQRPSLAAGWKELGLSHAQVGMLYLLNYHPDSSVKNTAQFLGISKSAVTQLMAPLVDKGFVNRRNDDKDRRIVRLSLEPAGKAALKKLAKHKFAGLRSALDNLDDKQLAQLHSLHQKMAADMEAPND